MTETFHCDDKDLLVAFLYDDIEPDVRRDVERHLRACAACAAEVEGLRAVRGTLQAWQPPEIDLGFTVVQRTIERPAEQTATVLRPARWQVLHGLPVWAQAAAAVLVAAVGLALANVQVRYDAAGMSVSTGWMTPAPAGAAPASAAFETAAAPSAPATDRFAAVSAPAEADAAPWRAELARLEATLRSELTAARRADSRPAANETAILRRVEELMADSEQRVLRELAFRMTQLNRDVELRRSADLLRINQDLGRMQGRTAVREQEMMNMLRRVSVQQVP